MVSSIHVLQAQRGTHILCWNNENTCVKTRTNCIENENAVARSVISRSSLTTPRCPMDPIANSLVLLVGERRLRAVWRVCHKMRTTGSILWTPDYGYCESSDTPSTPADTTSIPASHYHDSRSCFQALRVQYHMVHISGCVLYSTRTTVRVLDFKLCCNDIRDLLRIARVVY